VLEILAYTPRFLVADADAFRRLVAQIVENSLRQGHQFYSRLRRDRSRQAPLPDDTVLCLDPRVRAPTSPSQHACRGEEEAWLRLALDLLAPQDRDVIVLREWGGHTFAEIGGRLGIAENAARMRFERALARLVDRVQSLRRGEF
jgi:RNA polymerase sigma factor (sigma-70 family)